MRRSELEAFFLDPQNWIIIEILDPWTKTHSPPQIAALVKHFIAHREPLTRAYWERKMSGMTTTCANKANARRNPNPPGFVYLCRNNRNGLTKIGFSRNPKQREYTLQSEDPDVSMFATFPGTTRAERSLHEQFAGKRVRGEWFNLSDEDCETITASKEAT